MRFYYTYVLLSMKDKKFYSGSSEDLKSRFEQHQKGKVSSTKDRCPLELIYYESCLNKSDAMKRERYFKTYKGKLFLRNRLKSYFTGWWFSNRFAQENLSCHLLHILKTHKESWNTFLGLREIKPLPSLSWLFWFQYSFLFSWDFLTMCLNWF